VTVKILDDVQLPDPSHEMNVDADYLQAVSARHLQQPPERQVLRSRRPYRSLGEMILT